jgi:hypothetical protein
MTEDLCLFCACGKIMDNRPDPNSKNVGFQTTIKEHFMMINIANICAFLLSDNSYTFNNFEDVTNCG